VHVVRTGQARPDVQELPDSGLVHQVAHRTAEESPVLPGGGAPGGDGRDRPLGGRPVHGEMVFPTEKVVVHACGVWLRGIDLRSHLPRFRIDTALAVFAGFTVLCNPTAGRLSPGTFRAVTRSCPRMTGNARFVAGWS